MQQTSTDQSIDPHDNTMMHDIISHVSNLFYEMMFVVDINTGQIVCIPPSSGLSRNILSKNISIKSLNKLFHSLKSDNGDEFSMICNAINEFYHAAEETHKSSLLFIAEKEISYHNVSHKATYKFTPICQPNNDELKYLIGAISLSSGTVHNTLHALNISDLKRHHYDFNSSKWIEYDVPKLSPIENDVLALSAEGLSVPEISEKICRANDSVKSIRKRIFTKLGVANITEAIIFATNYKII